LQLDEAERNSAISGFRHMKSHHLSSTTTLSLLVASLAVAVAPATASARCSEPSSAGVKICQPSASSTVYQVPHIEVAASPSSGSISSTKVFIDGKQALENFGPGVDLFPGGLSNGTHHLVVKATDDFGRPYQASEYFGVMGNLPSSCHPSAIGVRLCSPIPGAVISQNLAFAVGFRGAARVTHVQGFVDGKLKADFKPPFGNPDEIFAEVGSVAAGLHTLKITATDAAGHTYQSSAGFKAFYEGDCPPKGNTCTPGIYMNGPLDGDDVGTSFRVSASVQNYPAAINAMKVYLNGHQVAESTGPILDQQITTGKGTKIMVIQAWDSAGKLYRITQNVNVQ
jgi:hypothetical protein